MTTLSLAIPKYSNLSACLESNRALLGPSCENLGKTVGGGGFWSYCKIYLSFDDQNHWKIEQLNIFSVILRNVFGFFTSTHSNKIKNEIKKIITNPEESEAVLQIQSVWNRHNPFICLGNAPLSKARVICFADHHTDKEGASVREAMIPGLWEKGAIVIVEGVQAGKEVQKTNAQKPNLPDDYLEQGWEPVNFEQLHSSYTQRSKAHLTELNSCVDSLKQDLPMDEEFSPAQKSEIKGKLNKIKETLKKLNMYYKSTSPHILNIDKAFDSHFQLVSENKISGKILLILVYEPVIALSEQHYEAWNNTISPEQVQALYKASALRNDSLIAEIEKQGATGRKVIVIGGAAHLLQHPIIDTSCQKVKEALKKFPFCIITRAKFENTKLAPLNPDLRQQ
jgi:hypothetical protein